MRIAGILLAAGHSRRFSHGNKLLYPLQDGLPTALIAARNLVAADLTGRHQRQQRNIQTFDIQFSG